LDNKTLFFQEDSQVFFCLLTPHTSDPIFYQCSQTNTALIANKYVVVKINKKSHTFFVIQAQSGHVRMD